MGGWLSIINLLVVLFMVLLNGFFVALFVSKIPKSFQTKASKSFLSNIGILDLLCIKCTILELY